MPETGPQVNQDLAKQILSQLKGAGYNVSLTWVINKMGSGWGLGQFEAWAAAHQNEASGGGTGGIPNISLGGSSSSGGSSGGSSSGSSGPTGPDPAVLRASYVGLLHSWGISPGEVASLVNQAVSGEWTSSQFTNALRQTKAYKKAFFGINSQPGMSEGTYLSQFRAFKGKYQDIGRNLTREQFGTLLKKGVEYSEWQFRVKALENIEENRQLFNWYEQELRRRGELKPKEQLKMRDLYDIVTKSNSERFEKIYETAYLTQNLARIGFDLQGKGRDISRKDILKMVRQFEAGTPGAEVEKLGAQDFAALADDIETTIPLSKLQGVGVTKADLLELRLGGKNALAIKERVDVLRASFNLKNQGTVQPQLVQTEGGTRLLGYEGLEGDEGE